MGEEPAETGGASGEEFSRRSLRRRRKNSEPHLNRIYDDAQVRAADIARQPVILDFDKTGLAVLLSPGSAYFSQFDLQDGVGERGHFGNRLVAGLV